MDITPREMTNILSLRFVFGITFLPRYSIVELKRVVADNIKIPITPIELWWNNKILFNITKIIIGIRARPNLVINFFIS